MSYIRLNLNVGWWNTDVYVPNAQMHYQAWIQQWIIWAKENGDYVLLNRTNEYTIPPCGGSITYCPHQGEPSDIDDGYPQQQFNAGHLLDQTLVFWKSIVSFAHSHGHGAVINEWGGCLDAKGYNNALSNYAALHHIGMAYYQASNVVDPAWANINSNGLLMQAAYAKFQQ